MNTGARISFNEQIQSNSSPSKLSEWYVTSRIDYHRSAVYVLESAALLVHPDNVASFATQSPPCQPQSMHDLKRNSASIAANRE